MYLEQTDREKIVASKLKRMENIGGRRVSHLKENIVGQIGTLGGDILTQGIDSVENSRVTVEMPPVHENPVGENPAVENPEVDNTAPVNANPLVEDTPPTFPSANQLTSEMVSIPIPIFFVTDTIKEVKSPRIYSHRHHVQGAGIRQ